MTEDIEQKAIGGLVLAVLLAVIWAGLWIAAEIDRLKRKEARDE